jgi:predicted permease
MRSPQSDRGILPHADGLTNCGFMGFPLALAVFGEKGCFLMIIATRFRLVYLYTAGVLSLISARMKSDAENGCPINFIHAVCF